MTGRRRREILLTTCAALGAGVASRAAPAFAQPATITDSAGRKVPIPRRVERALPAGPPAAILLYTVAPETLVGWPRANRPEELEFLLPGVGAQGGSVDLLAAAFAPGPAAALVTASRSIAGVALEAGDPRAAEAAAEELRERTWNLSTEQ